MQNKLPSQPLLEIFLLGRFQVIIDGVPVKEKRWMRRSAQSLIKLLALKPFHALHREQIMDLLWTEETLETALNNLNKAIYTARRAFEPDLSKGAQSRFILTHKNQITLNSPGTLLIDLDEFERTANYALQSNDLEAGLKAVELYRGDLLTEDIYEDWIYTRRESLRILFRKTATKTAELYAAGGEHQASIEILKKLIAEDSSDEHVHRLLMRFYAETGSKYQALKQFEHCRAALLEINIEPEPKTTALGQSIKRGELLPVKNKSLSASAASTPRITPLTFQNGIIKSAHFLPDGETIVFSAAWSGGAAELYKMRLETGEALRLGINAEVFSISPAGEMAISLNPKSRVTHSIGTLALLAAADKTPQKLLKDVHWADCHPGKNMHSALSNKQFLAIVRDNNGKSFLEFPICNVIYETGGWISHPRFSPDGRKIAFIEHPLIWDDMGLIVLLDLKGKTVKEKKILTENWLTILGLAWSGDELWFTSSHYGARAINAVNLKGKERLLFSGTGNFTLRDVSKSGKALVTDDRYRVQIAVRQAGEQAERDLSWHDWSLPRDLTDDGETLLFEEGGVGGLSGGDEYSAYLRKIDGSSIKKISGGSAIALSPDGKYALLRVDNFRRLVLMPIGEGEMKPLETDSSMSLIHQSHACFFPDGKRILFAAVDKNKIKRIYIQDIEGGNPICFTPDKEGGVEMLSAHSISPDGKKAVLVNSENRLSLYQTSDGSSSILKNLEKGFMLLRWAGDGENLFIRRQGDFPAVVYKYNLASGEKEKWLELMPENSVGAFQIVRILLTPDGKTYAYSYESQLSSLYLMEDLK